MRGEVGLRPFDCFFALFDRLGFHACIERTPGSKRLSGVGLIDRSEKHGGPPEALVLSFSETLLLPHFELFTNQVLFGTRSELIKKHALSHCG